MIKIVRAIRERIALAAYRRYVRRNLVAHEGGAMLFRDGSVIAFEHRAKGDPS